jgi:hypothetical protein
MPVEQDFYRAVAGGLHERTGLRREDVITCLVEVKSKTGRSATASPSCLAILDLHLRASGAVPHLGLRRADTAAQSPPPMPWRSSVSGTEHADLPRRDPGLGARRQPRDDRLPPASASAVRLYLLRR